MGHRTSPTEQSTLRKENKRSRSTQELQKVHTTHDVTMMNDKHQIHCHYNSKFKWCCISRIFLNTLTSISLNFFLAPSPFFFSFYASFSFFSYLRVFSNTREVNHIQSNMKSLTALSICLFLLEVYFSLGIIQKLVEGKTVVR